MIRIYMLFMLVFTVVNVSAQSRQFSGEISSQDNNEKLAGVSITLKGTSRGTTTDANGKFTISIPAAGSAVLVVTNQGFKAQEINVAGRSSLNIVLSTDAQVFDQVVVVGYGSVKKRDLTGAVVSVKGDEVTQVPSTNPLEAIQGKVAGVDITRSSGSAGSGVNITVRGNRSIKAGNGPLYIVDGVQYPDVQDINPNDILSMDILKDASSTAIYGSRGANGVIIITTKKGAAGKIKVNFNAYNGFSQVAGFPKVLDGNGYANLRREANRTTGKWTGPQDDAKIFQTAELYNITNNISTRFSDLLIHDGRQQDYQLSFGGGSDKLKSYFSLDYFNEKGILKEDELERYSGRINLDYEISDMLKVGTQTQVTVYKQSRRSDPLNIAMRINPLTPVYDSAGKLIVYPNLGKDINPLIDEEPGAYVDESSTTRLFPTLYAELKPFKGFSIRTNFSVNINQSTQGVYRSPYTLSRNGAVSQSSYGINKSNSMNWQGILNYQKEIKGHSFTVTGIGEIINNKTEAATAQGQNQLLASSLFYNLSSNTQNVSIFSSYSETKLNSLAGRLNYSYQGKYLVTLTGRSDGASVLGSGHQWDFFPSAAFAWQIGKENFMDRQKIFTDLKLRASYGVSGNAAVGAYSSQSSLSRIPFAYGDNAAGGFTFSSQSGNPDLKWEKTATINGGLDFGVADSRITGSIDVYDTRTSDLLLGRLLPPTTGVTTVTQNVGKTHNRGIEIGISSVNIQRGKFKWTSNITFTRNKEEITELIGGVSLLDIGTATLPQFLVIGSPVNSFYDYRKLGIWQTTDKDGAAGFGQKPGDIRVADINGDGVIDTKNDRTVVGSAVPDWSGGFNNNITWGNFDINIYVYARIGQTINLLATEGGGTSLGHSIYDPQGVENSLAMLSYWTPENATNELPRPDASKAYSSVLYYNTLGYRDGSFVKLRNLSVGYKLPSKAANRLRMQNLRIYVTGRNLVTFSKVKEYDPERGGILNSPLTRLFVAGINVGF